MNCINVGDNASSNELFKPYFDTMGRYCSFTGLTLMNDGSAYYFHLIPNISKDEKDQFLHQPVRFYNTTVGKNDLNMTSIRGAVNTDFIFTCPFDKMVADNALHNNQIIMFLVDTAKDTIEAIRVITVNDTLKEIIQNQYIKIHENHISEFELLFYYRQYIEPYTPKELEKRSIYRFRDTQNLNINSIVYLL